jgi:hypothetical protein
LGGRIEEAEEEKRRMELALATKEAELARLRELSPRRESPSFSNSSYSNGLDDDTFSRTYTTRLLC